MDDLARLRAEYARRAHDPRYSDWYSPFNPANIFITQEREREIARLLEESTRGNLSSQRILDIGCGGGHELDKFIGYRAKAKNLYGVDMLWDRVSGARERYPCFQFVCCNAATLPYPDSAFDIVLQFTVFTSILDDALRKRIAAEMLRVLKPSGFVLWYDYRLNPTNPETHGIEKAEIKCLFPSCEYSFRRVTLAPPIARAVAPRSWILCAFLNLFSPLRTHYLAVIRQGDPSRGYQGGQANRATEEASNERISD